MKKSFRNSIIRLFDYSIIRRTRQGSALLIVLGLVSFMVISAVAFSAYMRQSRLPSSYLLRLSSSRNLVKAGLAESLDLIDRAIGNNPHPGVPLNGNSVDEFGNPVPNRNQWRDRVFYGTNQSVAVGTTVSTLSLEALAYVPAPLINDVRYHSRRSPAGVWHTLGFDSGRFAFTAIDVSDYFDVNRLMAVPANPYGNGGRTSAEDGRISLAYLFEGSKHATDWRTEPDAWDEFMDSYLGSDPQSGSTVPLISWADLNLAIWDQKPKGVVSPWCRYIENGTEFVRDDDEERLALSNMVFVTDSWYPQSKAQGTGVQQANLSDQNQQPFPPGLSLDSDTAYRNRGFDELLQQLNKSTQFSWDGDTLKWADLLAPPVIAQLADYLDVDSVPTSLALPCVERAPMITGVRLMGLPSFDVQVVAPDPVMTSTFVQNNNTYSYQVKTYTVKLNGDLSVMAGWVYPFKHKHETPGSFKAQAFVTATFVAGETDQLRRNAPLWTMQPDWAASEQSSPQVGMFSGSNNRPSGFWLRSRQVAMNGLDKAVATVDDAVHEDLELQLGSVGNFELASDLPASENGVVPQQRCTLRVLQKMQMVTPPGGGTPVPTPVGDPELEWGALPANMALDNCVTPTAGQEFTPSFQVWVRIVDGNDNTVDLVPACQADDRRLSEMLTEASGSKIRAALRFSDAAAKITFANNALSGGGQLALEPKGYLTDDPRFNYAPENFWAMTSDEQLQKAWKDKNRAGNNDRDGDIFMATSDAGYLQSKYELAHLLRTVDLGSDDDWGCLSGGAYDGKARSMGAALAADSAMWKTFSPYLVNGQRDDFETLQIISGTGGTRVCPYTPDTAVMMGALANTPYDWWAAGTNAAASATVKRQMLTSVDEALKYTFSDHANDTSTRIHYRDMEALARKLIVAFHASQTVDGWKTIYENLPWDGMFFDELENGSGVTLDSVDRKFLYGYWHDCFDTRQQLFLVFVRAEPMMMGGGANGAMPPMLGARAVALVWRDPTATKNNAPHKMRVLFYRQFD